MLEEPVDILEDKKEYRPRKKKNKLKAFFYLLLLLILFSALGVAGYFYYQLSEVKRNPQKVAQEAAQNEIKQVVDKVGELMFLPDEEVTVATVVDPDSLKDQVFFNNAKKGDKVLIYVKSQKAILYDPVAHRIIEVAPLNIPNEE